MAFTSLNTIGKDLCYSRYRSREGPTVLPLPGQGKVVQPSYPFVFPVSTCTIWFLPSLPLVLVMDVGEPAAYGGGGLEGKKKNKPSSVLCAFLVSFSRGTVALSISRELFLWCFFY